MKLKRPKSIAVGGHRYRVKMREGLVNEEGRCGVTVHASHKIEIDPVIGNKTVTFWEEALHCIDRVYFADKLEHPIIQPLSEAIYQVLKSLGIDFDWDDV